MIRADERAGRASAGSNGITMLGVGVDAGEGLVMDMEGTIVEVCEGEEEGELLESDSLEGDEDVAIRNGDGAVLYEAFRDWGGEITSGVDISAG